MESWERSFELFMNVDRAKGDHNACVPLYSEICQSSIREKRKEKKENLLSAPIVPSCKLFTRSERNVGKESDTVDSLIHRK